MQHQAEKEAIFSTDCAHLKVPVDQAVGMVLAHDITEIRPGEFKGRAFRRGQIIREENIEHLRRLGKEHLYALRIADDEIHEDEAALILARAICGPGLVGDNEPREGKINVRAKWDGLLKVNREMLLGLNILGEVMCATIHDNSLVKKGALVAGVRAIPLTLKKRILDEALALLNRAPGETPYLLEIKKLTPVKVGVVITGTEVFEGRIKDAFAPLITGKVRELGSEVIRTLYAPDDVSFIESCLRELISAGAELLIATGGMSVDPDDVTRFAIRKLGAQTIYGSAVLPGAMFLTGSLQIKRENGYRSLPILGIPACGMYHKTTILDLILPRILAGETIGRAELAQLGHGGLCLGCDDCRFPRCPFGKA